jgi:hypothetical protein
VWRGLRSHLLREAISIVQRIHVRALQPIGGNYENVDENEVVLKQLELGRRRYIAGLGKFFLKDESGCKEEDEPKGEIRVKRKEGHDGVGGCAMTGADAGCFK